MNHENPFQLPKARVADHEDEPDLQKIEALDVSDAWKKRFRAIWKAGGPSMPRAKELSKEDRKLLHSFNALAFFLGPFYYLGKGMWKRAITMTFLCVVTLLALGMVFDFFGWYKLTSALKYGVGAFYAAMANVHYYKKRVLDDNGWW